MNNNRFTTKYFDRSVPITEYLENENNVEINDCNKYCYSMDPIHLAESLDKILKLAACNFSNFDSSSFHIEPLSPLLSPYIITDPLWFQENLLCLIEQCISSSLSHLQGLFQIRVSLVNESSQSCGNNFSPNKQRRQIKSPRTPVSVDSPTCSRPQSLIIPQRPSALNYSSRSQSTASPRTMRATIAFSPKYLSPLFSTTTPDGANCLTDSQQQQQNVSSKVINSEEPVPMLRVEIVQPFSSPSTIQTKDPQVVKYPVHIMQRRINILGGSCKVTKDASINHSLGDSSNNVYFSIPFHPASDQDLSSAQQNLLSGKTLSHISLVHDEHPIFTPTHKTNKNHHNVPIASLPLHKILDANSPHSSLPHTPVATWKSSSSSSDSDSNSCDDYVLDVGHSTVNMNSLHLGKTSSLTGGNTNLRVEITNNKSIHGATINEVPKNSILKVKPFKSLRNSIRSDADLSIEHRRLNSPVILVDDSTLVLKLTRTVLERSGYVVQVAKNGLEAVQTICDLIAERTVSDSKASTLPVVLMDLQMPVLDGIEAVRRIRSVEESLLQEEKLASELLEDCDDLLSVSSNNKRSHFPPKNIVILALSANNHDTIVQEALDAGCDAFLQKPFNLEDFQQVMQQILICDDFDE